MNLKEWFKETFNAKRIVTSLTFSVLIFVTYWALKLFENAEGNAVLTFGSILIVTLIMLLFGGSFLDVMAKD